MQKFTIEPTPLPGKLVDWHRFLKQERTINDIVEEAHRNLIESDKSQVYLRFLYAVHDTQAVEGTMAIDNVEAARMIREYARDNGGHELAQEKLGTIVRSLNVVLKRYHASRKERAQTVAGEIVPNDEP